MIGQSFAEEIDCGNFFDNIDDLIDFPCDDIGAEFGNGEYNSFPSIWASQPDSLPTSDSVFSSKSNSDASTELYVPFEEIVQLEWLSGFADDSFSNKKEDSSSTNTDSSSTHSQSHFRSSSPVSVLESSSSSSLNTNSAAATALSGKRGRPRTKRPRPVVQEPKQEQEKAKEAFTSTSAAAESRLVIRIPKHLVSEHNNKKKKTAKVSSSLGIDNNDSSSSEQPIRKCMHCEVTKTPQWRQGPMGPKTLCNACGVRYKSGRLFPEYRPAASPTFMPSLHSNSHKKVVEMRSKSCESGPIGNTETGRRYLQELIPNGNTQIAIDYV